jgi:hypothetical protein
MLRVTWLIALSRRHGAAWLIENGFPMIEKTRGRRQVGGHSVLTRIMRPGMPADASDRNSANHWRSISARRCARCASKKTL